MKNTNRQTSTELASSLGKLFEDELKDIYWAENELLKATSMLSNTLDEEKNADASLTETVINIEAAGEPAE